MDTNRTHRFTSAGLGDAPFKVIGFGREVYQSVPGDPNCPIQPGACCDYCGSGIMNVYRIKSADGKVSKVGPECVMKTGDKGMIDKVKRAESRRKNKARKAREQARIERMWALLQMDAIREDFASRPHRKPQHAERGLTEMDWAVWMARCAGNRGRMEVVKAAESSAKDAGIDLASVESVGWESFRDWADSEMSR